MNLSMHPSSGFAAFLLCTICWFSSASALANESATAPRHLNLSPKSSLDAQRPAIYEGQQPKNWLNLDDRRATLHAIQYALSSVSDGGGYVWRRGHGLLSAIIRPTTSFKNRQGRVCRHVVIRLTSKRYSRQSEGIACLDNDGVWSLTG